MHRYGEHEEPERDEGGNRTEHHWRRERVDLDAKNAIANATIVGARCAAEHERPAVLVQTGRDQRPT